MSMRPPGPNVLSMAERRYEYAVTIMPKDKAAEEREENER